MGGARVVSQFLLGVAPLSVMRKVLSTMCFLQKSVGEISAGGQS